MTDDDRAMIDALQKRINAQPFPTFDIAIGVGDLQRLILLAERDSDD